MKVYENNLHIEDDTFLALRTDFDRVLQKLIKNMIEKDSSEGKITITVDVSLEKDSVTNTDPNIKGASRVITLPTFTHKVGSVLNIKDEAKGKVKFDGMELVFDEEIGEYVLRPVMNTEQATVYDADFSYVEDDNEDEYDEGALEGKKVASLPGPVEDGEFTEIVDEEEDDAESDDANEEIASADEEEDLSDEFEDEPVESIPFEDDGYAYEEPDEEV